MSDQKIKILCVEDEIDIRSNISDILRDEGYEVVEAENGYHAYELFIEHRPDLIISDIMMPKLDGFGLLKMVRDTTGLKNSAIPFIFLTALGQKENVLKGVNLSANDYLVKPIDFDLLIAKVKEKTENSKRIDDVHQGQISNLKNQISVMLPKDVFNYLDVITEISGNLKNEPYGPLPHRSYLEEIKKIYDQLLREEGHSQQQPVPDKHRTRGKSKAVSVLSGGDNTKDTTLSKSGKRKSSTSLRGKSK